MLAGSGEREPQHPDEEPCQHVGRFKTEPLFATSHPRFARPSIPSRAGGPELSLGRSICIGVQYVQMYRRCGHKMALLLTACTAACQGSSNSTPSNISDSSSKGCDCDGETTCINDVCVGSGLAVPSIRPVDTAIGKIVLAEMNQDGALDLVSTQPSEDLVGTWKQLLVLEGGGDGTFAQPRAFGLEQTSTFLRMADMNGDGQVDAITARANGGPVTVHLADGNGGFEAPISWDELKPVGIDVADLDQDGKVDVLAVERREASFKVLAGAGDGTQAARNDTPISFCCKAGEEHFTDLVVGDLDGDGYPEAVVGKNNGYSVPDGLYVVRNEGGILQSDGLCLGNEGYSPEDTTIVDLNGDDLPDIATETGTSHFNFFLGDGTGQFVASKQGGALLSNEVRRFVDLNADGVLDHLQIGRFSTPDRLEIRFGIDGTAFASPISYELPGTAVGLAVGDLNGDAQPDVVVSLDDVDPAVSSSKHGLWVALHE